MRAERYIAGSEERGTFHSYDCFGLATTEASRARPQRHSGQHASARTSKATPASAGSGPLSDCAFLCVLVKIRVPRYQLIALAPMLKDNTRELPGGVAKYAEADVFTCPSGPMQVHGCASAHCVCSVFVPSTPVGKDLSRDDWCSRESPGRSGQRGHPIYQARALDCRAEGPWGFAQRKIAKQVLCVTCR